MFIAATVFPFTEILILLFGVVIFCIALHFFLETRKSLQEALAAKNHANMVTPLPGINYRKEVVAPKKKKKPAAPVSAPPAFSYKRSFHNTPSSKETAIPRQKSTFVSAEQQERQSREEIEQLHSEIMQLEKMLEKKEEALDIARQEAAMVQQMENRIEELHTELERMQTHIAGLEKKSNTITHTAIALEEANALIEQQQQELNAATEKIEQAVFENEQLRQQLAEAEVKLAEANLQRKQLQKKLQLMQEVNDDLQNVTDANKKFKTDLKRIGELESMLNMIQEERDHLSKSRFK